MTIITISRGTFSGGQELAELVSEKLGYRCISRRVLTEAAERYGVSEEELSKAVSEAPHLWERWDSERMRYLACLRATLIAEVKDNNVVYHGLAGHFLLTGVPHVLRVRVIAGMESRIKAAMEHGNLTREDAIQLIKMVDEKRARRTRFLYHVDWADPSLYDLVLNLDHLGFNGACEIICRTVNTKQYQASMRSLVIVDNLVLSSHVEAILAADKSIGGLGIEVETSGNVVTLGGTVEWASDIDKIENIVGDIPGVRDIDSRMRVRFNWGEVEGLRIR